MTVVDSEKYPVNAQNPVETFSAVWRKKNNPDRWTGSGPRTKAEAIRIAEKYADRGGYVSRSGCAGFVL